MKIVAVTACPTGIAHTYMAAEKLEKTAKKLGHLIKVEIGLAKGRKEFRKKEVIKERDVKREVAREVKSWR